VQLLVVLAICIPLRLDVALAYVAAHVSNPLTLPFVLAIELETGSLVLSGRHAAFNLEAAKRLGVTTVGAQIACGALIVGTGLALVGALVAWIAVRSFQDLANREFRSARARTVARFADAPPSVRHYVRTKLWTDPALATIAALPGPFGRVVDAGCGYGQIGLALLELGRAEDVTGFDEDAERIAVANRAAEGRAHFEVKSLANVDFPEADTILFVDSLHYLPIDEQNRVLSRAVHALTPGGRLVVRDVDAGGSVRAAFTAIAERIAAVARGRKIEFGFRPTTDLVAMLSRLGLVPGTANGARGDFSFTNNVLTVGAKLGEAPSTIGASKMSSVATAKESA
jgi:SAM-dependent methyltransferase